jgi:hypothetical protein
MYLSQSTTTLVLLLLLTATLTYNTLDLQKNQVLTEMEASSIDLKSSSLEHIIESSLPTVFNRVLNDAELEVIDNYNNNPSGDPFFESTNYTLAYLKNGTEDIIVKDYLENVSEEYSNLGYTIDYNFSMTNITMVDGFTFKLDYDLYYKIQGNKGIIKEENISSYQYSTVKTVLDAYHHVKPTYVGVINVSNPNAETLYDFQVKVVFNDSNFDYSIEPTGEGLRFYDENGNYIPYWVEVWDYSDDDNDRTSVLWLKVPILDANTNTSISVLSTYPKISESNGNRVFEMFDDFEDSNSIYSKWNVYQGSWTYSTTSNIFVSATYNNKMVQCLSAEPVSRMISTDNTTLDSYTIEVDARGTSSNTDTPNTMLGYFADPQYLAETTTHPDAFYTFELGGREDDGSLTSLETYDGTQLYWDPEEYATYADLAIVNQYPVDYYNVHRADLDYSSQNPSEIWYRLKLNVIEDTVYGMYFTQLDYINHNEPGWMITETISNPYGSYFELGTSFGDHSSYTQNIYFDNFRVRKYASIEPTTNIYSLSKTVGINYITPPKAEGTKYVLGSDYNLYYEEADTYPSIIDMLAGEDSKSWEYGYGLKLKGYQ